MNKEPDARTLTGLLLLAAAEEGEGALARLVPVIYDELRLMARRQLGHERSGARTLQPTELVHEAYLRLVDETQVTKHGRAYFFVAAARAMRRVLVDRARRRKAAKRGGGQHVISLDEGVVSVDAFADELLELDEALRLLADVRPRQARVVECRYFGGLSVDETAAALGISSRTVKYDWALARAWLYKALRGEKLGGA